jgi:hypothetical protein
LYPVQTAAANGTNFVLRFRPIYSVPATASIIENMGEQDLGYKRVFAHREMVEDLLRGFVREPWVGEGEVE